MQRQNYSHRLACRVNPAVTLPIRSIVAGAAVLLLGGTVESPATGHTEVGGAGRSPGRRAKRALGTMMGQ